uniref:CRAL-TRIO domain-containing protein n=1 Tax=Kalanchoe fedtschenkoi TaxID=63787 RepID=A0A7N0TMH4_KALFE
MSYCYGWLLRTKALQLLCIPPFKWIQRWDPFKGLIKCLQSLSRPMLVLSVATTLSDQFLCVEETPTDSSSPQEGLGLQLAPSDSTSGDVRITNEVEQSLTAEKWLLQLHEELDKQGIVLPERINDDELRRFYIAANGDFSTLLSSVKKTVRWRQTYGILSQEELEVWSNLVFWHGHDVNLRPCLIIRLGLACANLRPDDKPRFAQAVVSQVEYGVLHLVEPQNPQIIVLMDCDGLSPLRFPMQMMRSIAVLLQDHYPNCLGGLFIVRLPPVARVIIQTLTQVLKPVTRKKLRILGDDYKKVLSDYLETLPNFLGGHCNCSKCSMVGKNLSTSSEAGARAVAWQSLDIISDDTVASLGGDAHDTESDLRESCEHLLRTAIIGALMCWIFIAFIIVWYNP